MYASPRHSSLMLGYSIGSYYPSKRADINPNEMRMTDWLKNVRNTFGLYGDCPLKCHDNIERFECLDNRFVTLE